MAKWVGYLYRATFIASDVQLDLNVQLDRQNADSPFSGHLYKQRHAYASTTVTQ